MMVYLKKIYNELLKYKISISFIVIIAALFGFHNIFQLGLISDDWDTFRAVSVFHSRNFGDVYNFFMAQSGVGIWQRPFWPTIMSLELLVFKQHYWMYFAVNALLLLVCAKLIFSSILRISKNTPLAFLSSVFFLVLPLTTSSRYWISSQMSLFAFFFVVIYMYYAFLEKSKLRHFITHGIFSVLFLVLGLLMYETVLSVGFFVVASSFFITHKFNFRRAVYQGILVVFAVILYFSYGYAIRHSVIQGKYTKEAGFSTNIGKYGYQMEKGLQNLLGAPAQRLFIDTLGSYKSLRYLESSGIIVFGLLIVTALVGFVLNKLSEDHLLSSSSVNLYLRLFSISFFSIIASIILLFPTNYNISLYPINDRINLTITLFVSILLASFVVSVRQKYTAYFVSVLVFLCLLVNLIIFSWFVGAYKIEKDFISYIKTIEIKDNTVIYFNTNALNYHSVPLLNTIWGVSYIISQTKDINYVEVGFEYKNFDLKTRGYKSNLHTKLKYENPNLVSLHFFVPEEALK